MYTLATTLLFACQPKPADTAVVDTGDPFFSAAQPGPYTAGFITVQTTDVRGKELTLEVWYPARVDEGASPDSYEDVALTLNGHQNALPVTSEGPFPLVAFSHGFGGIRIQSAFLTEHLASHGMVVVAPDHNHNTFLDLDESRVVDVLLERPDDIRYAVDAVLALSEEGDPFLGDMVELGDGYAMVGHSFGAYTTMVVAGGVVDPSHVDEYCATQSSMVCRYLSKFSAEQLEGHGTEDERALLSVPMSPGLWYLFGENGEGLQSVRQPFLLGGDRDQVLNYDREAIPTFDALSTPRALVTYADGGHYAPFSNSCDFPAVVTDTYFSDCAGPEEGWIDIASSQQATVILVTAYLKDKLLGDERHRVEWQTEGIEDNPAITMVLDD